MQIIFLRAAGVRHLRLSWWFITLCITSILFIGAGLTWFLMPMLQPHSSISPTQLLRKDTLNETGIAVVANRLGQLQARLDQLDSLSSRLGRALGLGSKKTEKEDKKENGAAVPTRSLSPQALPAALQDQSLLTSEIDTLAQHISFQQDKLGQLEGILAKRQLLALSWPNQIPVRAAHNTSAFGWRQDPFTGIRTFHEGMDLAAPAGHAILAAAPGKVVFAGMHSGYGIMAEIDHGRGIRTRYGHAQGFLVRPGDLVRGGQVIGSVGSTGRSTGSHLHFEVRMNGVAQNPQNFLGVSQATLLAQAS